MPQAKWVKASKSSGAGQCVEVQLLPAGVAVRDSKNPDGGSLFFTFAEWGAFLHGANAGEFTPEALEAAGGSACKEPEEPEPEFV